MRRRRVVRLDLRVGLRQSRDHLPQLFLQRFMRIEVSLPLNEALDLAWQTLAECFEPQELLMKQELIDRIGR